MPAVWVFLFAAVWLSLSERGATVQGLISVIDGDTVRADGAVFRLVGFDAPEAGSNARCGHERTLASAATDRLRMLAARPDAVLQPVSCHCRPGSEGTAECNYGRRCGILTVEGRNAGAILIEEGLARPYECGRHGCPQRKTWCG